MRRRPQALALLALVACLAAAGVTAQEAPPPPCGGAEYRQFDFWIGAWDVAGADGTPQGTNRIEPILGGCVLRESWAGAGGSEGHSFNLFDRQTGRWHQTWVDNSGLLLVIEGGLDEDGAMVLSGTGKTRAGAALFHRITWTPLADGRVRQHWQTSTDGEAWSDAFLGFYSRQPGAAEGAAESAGEGGG
ncbi:MAG: DUF1579 domain-containing protein [Acidobacteriota bacterium]|nr:DUF1579 domain-containing protein [Acidobacteriota bacterium]MDH3522361.1 DUF1579 domain-containing protein [Acidobacteriota bacterium]